MARYNEDDRPGQRERIPSYSSDSGYDWGRRRSKSRDRRRGERDPVGATRHRSRGREDMDRRRRDDHSGRKRSYSPDRHRYSRDRRRDRHDYDDIYEDRPPKGKRSNSHSPSPPRRSRQSRSPSPYSKRSKAPVPPQEAASRNNRPAVSRWNEFYTRASAIHRDLEERATEEPIDLFDNSHTTLSAIDETLKKIEKEELYIFPKNDDPTLHAACEALSHALQKAKEEHDTPEIKQALHNLRNTYDEAAESNTVSMRYIDVEPPLSPFSPLNPPHSLKRMLLARSWVKELITEVHNQSIHRRILVVGNQGSGESLGLPPLVYIANKSKQERYPCRILALLPYRYGRTRYPPDGRR
jgi:hypothetical protein